MCPTGAVSRCLSVSEIRSAVRSFAEALGETEHVSLLNETLEEEKETDEKLTELAQQINSEANLAGEEEMGERQKAEQQKENRKKPRRVA
jgi:ferritin-like metal-binding protein YciE